MRGVAAILLVAYAAVVLVPACFVIDFLVERQHIERDLCVQRMVVEGKRTCHGQCYLMKKLGRSDQREKGLPNELRELRMDEAVLPTMAAPAPPAPVLDTPPAHVRAALCEGCVRTPDPVPWC